MSAEHLPPAVEVRHLSKRYSSRHAPDTVALDDVSLRIERGEFVAIVGPSGGGKSTLLNMLGLLDFPDSGEYFLDGERVPSREGVPAARIRRSDFAFIFQSFHLLHSRPVRDSVELGLLYRGVIERRLPAEEALARVGLGGRADERASRLSGGQQQRVAIARAIASHAKIVFADEPTGNLDSENARLIVAELAALNAAGATVIVVTHSDEVAAAATRRLRIQDGRVVSDSNSAPAALGISSGEAEDVSAEPRRHSTLRVRDVLADAWRSVHSRPSQTIALCLAVAIAVALTLTTWGISTSASAQVSSAFDAQLNREVSASWENGAGPGATSLPEAAARAGALAGVDAAAALGDFDPVAVMGVGGGRVIQPHVYAGDLVGAARLVVRTPTWRGEAPLTTSEVLIGEQLADLLELGDVDRGPTVDVDGRTYQVAGIVEDSPRLPLLRGEVLFAEGAPGFSQPKTVRALLLTEAGAAQQVASQTPIAVHPYAPDLVSVQAPTTATALRVSVEQGVQTTLVVFSVLAIVVAVAALANAMLLAVTARRGEIGMRKALGARSRHIAWLLASESLYVGLAGGVAGLVIGILVILVITLSQRWAPVFDVRLGPLAVLAGIVIGVLGGSLAAFRAARIRPAETLRQ